MEEEHPSLDASIRELRRKKRRENQDEDDEKRRRRRQRIRRQRRLSSASSDDGSRFEAIAAELDEFNERFVDIADQSREGVSRAAKRVLEQEEQEHPEGSSTTKDLKVSRHIVLHYANGKLLSNMNDSAIRS